MDALKTSSRSTPRPRGPSPARRSRKPPCTAVLNMRTRQMPITRYQSSSMTAMTTKKALAPALHRATQELMHYLLQPVTDLENLRQNTTAAFTLISRTAQGEAYIHLRQKYTLHGRNAHHQLTRSSLCSGRRSSSKTSASTQGGRPSDSERGGGKWSTPGRKLEPKSTSG